MEGGRENLSWVNTSNAKEVGNGRRRRGRQRRGSPTLLTLNPARREEAKLEWTGLCLLLRMHIERKVQRVRTPWELGMRREGAGKEVRKRGGSRV